MTIKAFNLNKIRSLKNESDREVKGLIITVSLFAAAMIIGAGAIEYTSEYTELFNDYLMMRSNEKFHTIFFNSFFVNLCILIIINFAGLSCAGIPVIVFIVITKGLGAGVFSGLLYSQFTLSGIGYYLITVLPVSVITNTALLLACNNSVFTSADILAVSFAKKQADINIIKNYLKKNLIIMLICIFASILDCVLTKSSALTFIF